MTEYISLDLALTTTSLVIGLSCRPSEERKAALLNCACAAATAASLALFAASVVFFVAAAAVTAAAALVVFVVRGGAEMAVGASRIKVIRQEEDGRIRWK